MNQNTVTPLIGLGVLSQEIESICRCSPLKARPRHFIIPLDPGSGRTTVIQHMADKLRSAGILDFTGGLDDYLEITLDGTLSQLRQAFRTIDSAAVYANEYRGIIGMDISKISDHLCETQCIEFMENCKKVCAHAWVVFFVHAVPDRKEAKLLAKLCDTVGNIKYLTVEPYTQDDLCALIIKNVSGQGVEIKNAAAFRSALSEFLSEFCISTVQDVGMIADMLISFADFSKSTPQVDESRLRSMMDRWEKKQEGGQQNGQKRMLEFRG